ncbi:hypothetical protein [Spongiactinospora sp. TRM90649]|uniref:hypothetical protein n=1 Tax=Spongiactinospora sp. TRM90649 TaxID=3031114 RepID=UPI0023F83391|nr:hypothetical protein [Spongiactinospora sp. TRM90649]MDF5751928.1 hypothetical protein [Spongiactinospora sp. TRM90649]
MRPLTVIVAATVCVIGTIGLTGCTPPISGSTGISVDADGHPVIVLAWCGDAAPDGVHISHHEDASGRPLADAPDGPSPAATSVDDVNLTAPYLRGRSAAVRLDAPAYGWSAEPRPLVLRPGVRYHAFGYRGRGHGQVNTQYLDFSAERVARLTPDTVLIQRADERRSPPASADAVISREEFARQGRDAADC